MADIRHKVSGPIKAGGRSLTRRLPPEQATMVRREARKVLSKLGLASPTGKAAAAKPKVNIPTQDLAHITDPESDHAMCPLCGTTASSFLPFGVKQQRPDCRCPGCGSLERHRLVWLFFGLRTDLFTAPSRLLHIAPEPTMSTRLGALPNVTYLSGDLDPTRAMVGMDITSIDRPDHSFDVIYASHVLEHIPDDVLAMSELRRVLAPNGWAVLEVPIHGPTTREDLSITDPDERNRLFGQHDHVRMYGHDGEYQRRLRKAGFDVEVVQLAKELGDAATRRYRLRPDEDVYLCRPAR